MSFQREGVGTSKIRTSKGQNVKSTFRMIRMSKDQNVKNQNVKTNVKSLKMTFDVMIFFDAIANIRTLKVLVHFLAKNTFNILILPMESQKIRTSKIEKINYLWCNTYVYQGLWGVRIGSIRLG
jgi:hypothetical protein